MQSLPVVAALTVLINRHKRRHIYVTCDAPVSEPFDGSASEEVVADGERIEITDGELSIRVTQKDDSGRYTCTGVNNMGQDSASAYLSVTSESARRTGV